MYMNKIKNIIFDLGGVIINLDTNKTKTAFSQLGAENFEQLFRIGHAESFFKDYEDGTITDDEFVQALKGILKPGTSEETIVAAWNAMLLDFPPERIELLKELGKTYRLFLFSNTNEIHLKAFNAIFAATFGELTIDSLFEKSYYSHTMKMRKPDVAAFQKIIDENKLHPKETLFVDDAIVNIEGAKKAGLQTLFLEPPMQITEFDWKMI
jgi:glucose-1-phosphatase